MNKEELLEFSKKYAEKQGLKINPNSAIVDRLLTGLLKKEEEFGKRYCPCFAGEGGPEKRVCPCVPSKEEIEKQGYCHCTLFMKKDFSFEG